MRIMGLETIYPKPRLSKACKENKKYPYLLRGLSIVRPKQVWSTDITYIRLHSGSVSRWETERKKKVIMALMKKLTVTILRAGVT